MISFHNAYTSPVEWQDKDAILTLFEQQGFVVFGPPAFPDGVSDSEAQLKWLESRFHLGEHRPSVFNEALYPERLRDAGYNQIGAVQSDVVLPHDAFDNNTGQAFHVDGIFRASGELKTVLLACQRPAVRGGDNPLCNMIGLVSSLIKGQPHWEAALRDPRSMCRRSTYQGNDRCSLQPILFRDPQWGRDVVNFSLDSTVDWAYSEQRVPHLRDVNNEIKQQMGEDSDYRLTLSLKQGEVLMLNNAWLAHGRTAFVDAPSARRVMVRGKYKALPS